MASAFQQLTQPVLRYFLEVARYQSIAKASEQLHIANSAISRQISQLEASLGVRLFERRNGGMWLTQEGELLVVYARKVVLDTDHLLDDINSVHGQVIEKIRLASVEGFAMYFLPNCIVNYQKLYPNVKISLNQGDPHAVTQSVQKNEADIAITFTLTSINGVRTVYEEITPVRAIVPVRHPLASKETTSIAEIIQFPMALPNKRMTVRQLFDMCLMKQQLACIPAFTSNYFSALIQYVICGGGVSLSSQYLIDGLESMGLVKGLTIKDKDMKMRKFEIQVASGRQLPDHIRDFIAFLISQFQEKKVDKVGKYANSVPILNHKNIEGDSFG